MTTNWDKRFLDLAALVATWSKDPSTKCGAVIVRPDNTVCSLGYNGFPRGLADDETYYNDREIKYSRVVHCEMNALLFTREPVRGYTLYVHPFLTCDRCAVHIIQSGIARVVAPSCPPDKEARWGDAFQRSRQFYHEANVAVVELQQQ